MGALFILLCVENRFRELNQFQQTKSNMSIVSTLFVVVCSIPLIFGQRYVPPPGYERRYGAKDVNEWPSKKVYDEKTPRPTPYYGKGNWMKPTPKPTEYIKTPKAPKTPEPTKDSYKGRTYSADEIYTELEKIFWPKILKRRLKNNCLSMDREERKVMTDCFPT